MPTRLPEFYLNTESSRYSFSQHNFGVWILKMFSKAGTEYVFMIIIIEQGVLDSDEVDKIHPCFFSLPAFVGSNAYSY